MRKNLLASALSLALCSFATTASADERLVRFEGGIGVIPFASFDTNVTPNVPALNVVRNTQPGGQPWVIEGLKADVRTDGRISVDGRGLLLAGGNGIGTNGGQNVRARLFCGPTATATPHTTGAVPLEADGDFRINDNLTPPPPEPCTTPVLLIININEPPAITRWFAAGIPTQ
jgi:hypothetical protein